MRKASSAENSTSSNRLAAYSTDRTAVDSTSLVDIFSLAARWIGLVARKTWQRRLALGAGCRARKVASMSFSLARDREQKIGPSTSPATRRMQSSSPGEAAAKPASMTSTPRSVRTLAIFTLA